MTVQQPGATTPDPWSAGLLRKMNAYWCACNYLAADMIYLRDNPLLREPLQEAHIKERLLGHWGASPGLAFMWVHMNRIIREQNQEAIFLAGPGHGAPGVLAPTYLEATYSEFYPTRARTRRACRPFSSSSPSPAASAPTAPRRPPARSTRAGNWAIPSPTPSTT